MAQSSLTSPVSDATSFATSSSQVDSRFDVFLNHRGLNVKKNLASHLYRSLKKHGLRVFLDDQEMRRGDGMIPQIQRAIQTASVHVAIFSQRYAESTWCLDELVMMLESRSTIIPVFWHVNPSELRWTQGKDGLYARALNMLEKKTTSDFEPSRKKPRHGSNTMEKWRNALSQVSYISGFELKSCDGDEGLLVELVVQEVLKTFSKTPLNVGKYPTGLDDKVKEFERKMLSQHQGRNLASVVGIVGLGGVGKSTLAKELFNRHRSDYDVQCFLSDVRENAAKNSLQLLQATLLKDLAQWNGQINGVDEGIEKLKRHLSSSPRAFIVLDDVDHIKQLEALFSPVKDAIHPSSLVIVTSRNKDLLINSDIPECSIYRLTGLNPEHSQELFCLHAFGQSHPFEGFDKVVKDFLDACKGSPLSLKVIGALLRGRKDLNHWNALLRKISKILPDDIQSTLKISYDSLDEWEKQIFLDIACFFIGEGKHTAIRIWNGSGWEGELVLSTLENRCLVDVDSKNFIRMHDHLRDLGRDLAEKEKEQWGCRLWRPTDSHLHDLSCQSPVRGISRVHLSDPEQSFENIAGRHLLTNMRSLQLLRAEGHFVERLFRVGHFSQLIYLRWDNCPLSSLPSSFPIANLRVLYLEGKKLETLWQHEYEAPVQLRELIINAQLLKIIPDSIGKLKHLQKFALHSSGLETLPDSVGNLTSLQSINLDGCSKLQMLPDSVGNMRSLQSINLSRCSNLQMLPDSAGKMTNLRSLNLASCPALQMLPDSVGEMTSLQSLNLGRCSALQMLPDSVGKMTSLQSLNLASCPALQMLPDSVWEMTSLQRLNLEKCLLLQMLPDSVGKMTSLQSLNLAFSPALQMLPDSVGEMTSLQSLNLANCYDLQKLPDSVGKMMSLQILDLSYCKALQTLPDSVGKMTSLQHLHFIGCSALQTLPDSVGERTSGQYLSFRGCSALRTLPGWVGNMTSLQCLDLSGCHALQMLPESLKMLTELKKLTISEMNNLELLEEDCGSSEVASQNVGGGIKALTDQSRRRVSSKVFPHLQHLKIFECHLIKVRALPSTLVELELAYCSGSCKISGHCGLSKLRRLTIKMCGEVEELLSIGTLISLDELRVNACFKLKRILELAQMTKLRILEVSDCHNLEELPGVEYLSSLEGLYVHECPKLQWSAGVVEQLCQQLGEGFIEGE